MLASRRSISLTAHVGGGSTPGQRLAVCLFLTMGCATGGGMPDAVASEDGSILPSPTDPTPEWNCGVGCYREPRVPETAISAFEKEADEDASLTLVYPLARSVHPSNLTEITFQFRRSNAAQVWFELHLVTETRSPSRSYDFFIPCLDPEGEVATDEQLECHFKVPPPFWAAIAEGNSGRSLTIELTASDRKNRAVARSVKTPFAFSEAPVSGGFYYWSTALRGTYRLPFGAREAVPWIEPDSASNRTECGGCHAVSRNGNVIAFTAEAAAGYLQVADAADPTLKSIASDEKRNSSTLALNADGSRVITAYDGKLALLEAATGKKLAEADRSFFGGDKTAFFPEFSADGSEVAVTLSDVPDSFWAVRTGEIAIIPLSDDSFGEPRVIVSSTEEVCFYPSWSPDGQWIVFVSAPIFDVSYDQPNSRLRLVHRDGGRVYALDHATQGVGNTSTMPKVAPFMQQGGEVMFFTFNSKLDYGFLLKNSAIDDPAERRPQLWLSAIDLDQIESGDPSSAPVWLPFQQVDQHNHLGFWTERVSCGDGGDAVAICGRGELCVDGSCRVVVR